MVRPPLTQELFPGFPKSYSTTTTYGIKVIHSVIDREGASKQIAADDISIFAPGTEQQGVESWQLCKGGSEE